VRFRVAPLRQAVIFAAVFVFARVVYAAVFAGAGGAGIPLLALPLIALPAPFTGVRLLGPVTLDGVGAVARSAVPFAAVILGFGLLNALFDVRPWFAAGARRGPLRSFARALVIAWQTLPALALALRRAARAARLRGERPGPRVLVPVLEDAIERAVALAA
jgi:energy-coupling factor transport system ATP-binding protein